MDWFTPQLRLIVAVTNLSLAVACFLISSGHVGWRNAICGWLCATIESLRSVAMEQREEQRSGYSNQP